MQLLPANKNHYCQILELNKASVPDVNLIEVATLEKLANQSVYFQVAVDESTEPVMNVNQNAPSGAGGEKVVGFMIALDETADYESPNYRYFKQNYKSFTYVDRIVISKSHQGKGIGRQLYAQLKTNCKGSSILCCEVNIRPPNPESIAFHQSLGFKSVGNQETEQGEKSVTLMVMKNESSFTTKHAN